MENARTIPAQRQALGRALDNILENAVRFTPAGGTITLDAVEEGQEIVFTVTDTGPGFSPEALRPRPALGPWPCCRPPHRPNP